MSARLLPTSRRAAGAAALTGAALAALVALSATGRAAAQASPHQFSVTTRAGAIKFDRAASLETSAALGVDAEYSFNRYFALGTQVNVSRPNTRPEDFVTAVTFGISTVGDTTLFLETAQSVSLIEGSVLAVGRYPLGRVTAFVLGGGGLYGMFMDPEINRGQRRMDGWTMTAGGGFNVRLSDRVGVQLDVRDLMFRDYKWNRLDPSDARSPNITFPEDFPAPPSHKSTVHNVMFSLGFRYIPIGARRGGGGGEGGSN